MDVQAVIEGVDVLPDSYVSYELRIRQQNLLRSTLASRKRRLIAILKREHEEDEVSDMAFFMPIEDDLNECDVLIEEIAVKIRGDLSDHGVDCEIQLMYLRDRVDRLAPTSELNQTRRDNLLERIGAMEKRFKDLIVVSGLGEKTKPRLSMTDRFLNELNNFTLSTTLDEAVPVTRSTMNQNTDRIGTATSRTNALPNVTTRTGTYVSESQSIPPQLHNDTPHVTFAPEVPAPNVTVHPNTYGGSSQVNDDLRNHRQPSMFRNGSSTSTSSRPNLQIWKWKVEFSGDNDASACDFIQKVKDLAQSRSVTNEELLNGMPELLSGSAAKWFRASSANEPFASFEHFTQRFLEDFEPFFRIDTRLEQLKKRLQRYDERIVVFFAHVENEFLAMPNPPTIYEQVRIVRRLLLPRYVSQLSCLNFSSLKDLKRACQQIEMSQEIISSQDRIRGTRHNNYDQQKRWSLPTAPTNNYHNQSSGQHQMVPGTSEPNLSPSNRAPNSVVNNPQSNTQLRQGYPPQANNNQPRPNYVPNNNGRFNSLNQTFNNAQPHSQSRNVNTSVGNTNGYNNFSMPQRPPNQQNRNMNMNQNPPMNDSRQQSPRSNQNGPVNNPGASCALNTNNEAVQPIPTPVVETTIPISNTNDSVENGFVGMEDEMNESEVSHTHPTTSENF